MPGTGPLVDFRGISKRFHRRTTVRAVLTQVFGLRPGRDAFWALRDVTFQVKRGECLGIIGPNGAGKTTALRLLAGVTQPTEGRITLGGRTGSLIDVRAGFHPELSGRENVYLVGAIYGMSRREIAAKFDRIVEFSGLGDVIDMPVKRYSSGMFVRLGFSVAAHVEPDILLIDEVLAVGDHGFRARCYNYIAETLSRAAVVFVSHSMAAIARICDRVMVLKEGEVLCEDRPEVACVRYQEIFGPTVKPVVSGDKAEVRNLRIVTGGREAETLRYGSPCSVLFDVEVPEEYSSFNVSLSVMDAQQQLIAQCHSEGNRVELPARRGGVGVEVRLPEVLLNPGEYYLSLVVFDSANVEYLSWHHAARHFRVEGDFLGSGPVQVRADWLVDGSPARGRED